MYSRKIKIRRIDILAANHKEMGKNNFPAVTQCFFNLGNKMFLKLDKTFAFISNVNNSPYIDIEIRTSLYEKRKPHTKHRITLKKFRFNIFSTPKVFNKITEH